MILAIDPGATGAIAYRKINPPKSPVAFNWHTYGVVPMPKTEHEIIEQVKEILKFKDKDESIVCYMESVHSMPCQGVTSVFTFGKHYGFLRGVIQSLNIPLIDVSPQKWMKEIGVPKFEDKNQRKNWIHQYVAQRHPDMNIAKYAADAVAIMEYALEITNRDKQNKGE